ncbi:MAG: hypothetical protein AAFQ64_18815 [Pseudomonadota bacterium]
MTANLDILQPATWAPTLWNDVRQKLGWNSAQYQTMHLAAVTKAGEMATVEVRLRGVRACSILVDREGFEIDGEVLQPSQIVQAANWPVRLRLDGELFAFFDPSTGGPTQSKRTRRRNRGLRAVAILAGGILLSGVSTDLWVNAASGELVVRLEGDDTENKAATALNVEESFTGRIAEANLSDLVTIRLNENDHSLVATGSIPASASSDWEAALRWYDLLGTGPTLVSKVSVEARNVSLPEVGLVKLGADAELILRNGARLREGDAIDGLVVQEIVHEGLTFQRGLERFSMPLGKEATRVAH